jgi:hypothetical protein
MSRLQDQIRESTASMAPHPLSSGFSRLVMRRGCSCPSNATRPCIARSRTRRASSPRPPLAFASHAPPLPADEVPGQLRQVQRTDCERAGWHLFTGVDCADEDRYCQECSTIPFDAIWTLRCQQFVARRPAIFPDSPGQAESRATSFSRAWRSARTGADEPRQTRPRADLRAWGVGTRDPVKPGQAQPPPGRGARSGGHGHGRRRTWRAPPLQTVGRHTATSPDEP